MFKNDVMQTYNHLDASAEILIMLTGAFLLGCLLCWLLRSFFYKGSTSGSTHEVFYDPGEHQDRNISTFRSTQDKQELSKNISSSTDTEQNHQKAENKTTAKTGRIADFTIIKGITPKIESELRKRGINTYSDLRDIKKESLKAFLNTSTASRVTKQTAKTWSHQAALAAKADWRKLSEYQDFIEQSIKNTLPKKQNLAKPQNNHIDNLQKIKGINSQIEKILNEKGIYTYKQLRKVDAETLKEYLSDADHRLRNNQTATWSHQANMADKGQWDELSTYQDYMDDINIDTENLAATVNKTSSILKRKNRNNLHGSSHDTNNQESSKSEAYKNYKADENNILKAGLADSLENPREKQTHSRKHKPDDLTIIEGINPEIEKLLQSEGIDTFEKLHKLDPKQLQKILNKDTGKDKSGNSESWIYQAGMASRGEWGKLKSYQKELAHSETQHKNISEKDQPQDKDKDQDKNKDKDDLKKIEGIGPKIEEVLNSANIVSFKDLMQSNRESLKSLLNNAGPQFRMHEPETWPIQAEMAYNGEWEKLQEYQEFLMRGRE